jgi:putative membrane-bound dehydrogenase-like protein
MTLMERQCGLSRLGVCVLTLLLAWTPTGRAEDQPSTEVPRARDPRLVVERVALAPEIVHPISMTFDSRGRLLVIESHTHFRPVGYSGPDRDRVRLVEDTDGDGKADRFGTFFEGTRYTMDIAAHPDGSIYLATRNEILQLRDADGDGKAEESKRLIFLDTPGNYPHNGLSGLCFDSKGDLIFGMGENLGADYLLRGPDGKAISGGGEGGHVFVCSADGKDLRRLADGFWNPFGICRDIFGRLFAVDNDPDAMPPCRLLQVVEGGDYGFQFRYGRSGRHIFQAWNGELPGTLPMVAGTGEAPCEVVSYESDALPRAYLGNLLVTSWADHRIERYVLKPRGASFISEMDPLVQGAKDFRPVGLAVAPDGSLFVSDWVLRDYNLHGKGALWHIRVKDSKRPERSQDPRRALLSAHRPLREDAARRLAGDERGREFLRESLASDDPRVRASSLTSLIDADHRQIDLNTIAANDHEVGIRAMAVRALVARGEDTSRFLDARNPAEVRKEAIGALKVKADLPRLLPFLDDQDSFLRNAAVQRLAHAPELLAALDVHALTDPRRRIGVLLAERASGRLESTRLLADFLSDSDEDVRFLAAKWVADEKQKEFRSLVAGALRDPFLNVRMHSAFSTALARIDNQDASESKLADYFFARLLDDASPPSLRARALQLVPATHPRLTLDLLLRLLDHEDDALRLEAARTLSEHPSPGRAKILLDAARNPRLGDDLRAQAILGLAGNAQDRRDDLLALTREENATLRDEALRALSGALLTSDHRTSLESLAREHPQSAPLVARLLGQTSAKDRPTLEDVDAWLKRLEGPADVAAGRRVFFHPKLAYCARCHRVDGRGREVGPDLSTIGRRDRRQILESILQPSREIGPSYQNWQVATTDGKVMAGMLVHTNLDEYTYLDANGSLFKLRTPDVEERRALPTSIMPAGLPDLLTDQELRDLLAYLGSRR